MSELLVALPLALPVIGAAACLVTWRSIRAQRGIAIGAMAALLSTAVVLLVAVVRAGPLELAVGGWQAPIGIMLRADLTGALMTLITAVIGLAVAVYALADVPPDHEARGFWPLFVLLVMGVCGAFLTGDLFNLFVWFEVLLVSSFVLLSLGSTQAALRGTHVYLILNLIGSTLLLVAVGVVYGAVRSLDFAQVSERMADLATTDPGTVIAAEGLLLAAFGIKAAVFPLMFWLPASYHTPTPAVSALFSALLTKVGVYAMIRVTSGVFPTFEAVHTVLVAVAIATMLVGVLGALAQDNLRRILSFHIVSQIGYMVAGLAVAIGAPRASRFAIAAALFYVVHHILVKANLFLIAGIVRHVRRTEALAGLGGLARSHPLLAALFLISALSLAGVPPLSGFWAKLAIIVAGVERGSWALVVVVVLVGFLTLTSMIKIWIHAFLGEAPQRERPGATPRRDLALMYAGSILLAVLTLVLSVAPDLLFQLSLGAAEQLAAASRPTAWTGGAP